MEALPRPDDHLVEPLLAGLGAGSGEPPAAPVARPWWRRALARLAAVLGR